MNHVKAYFFLLLIIVNRNFSLEMGSRFRWDYKDSKSFEERLEEAQRIRLIYPDCIPVRNSFFEYRKPSFSVSGA